LIRLCAYAVLVRVGGNVRLDFWLHLRGRKTLRRHVGGRCWDVLKCGDPSEGQKCEGEDLPLVGTNLSPAFPANQKQVEKF